MNQDGDTDAASASARGSTLNNMAPGEDVGLLESLRRELRGLASHDAGLQAGGCISAGVYPSRWLLTVSRHRRG